MTLPIVSSPNSQDKISKYDWIKNPDVSDIYDANFGVKLREMRDTNQAADFIKLVKDWRMYLGIKDEITDEELEFNSVFIKSEYPDWTIEKIRLAIKYSLKGELKVDIKPYGAFSPLYISTILNAYEKYQGRIISNALIEKNRKEVEGKNKTVELGPDQKIASRREFLTQFFFLVNTETPTPDTPKQTAWNFLVKNGLIDPAETDKLIAGRKMEEILANNPGNEITNHLTPESDKIERYFRLLAMQQYCHENPVNIEDFTNEQIML